MQRSPRRAPQNKALGVETPLFLDVPDAAAYTFQVENGYSFDTLTIDLSAGDAVLIDPVIDLFLPVSEHLDRGRPVATVPVAGRDDGI